jgi:hypothetical protein
MKDVSKLALQRIRELAQTAMTTLHEMEKWREPKLTDFQKTEFRVQHDRALNEISEWLKAIEDVEDED